MYSAGLPAVNVPDGGMDMFASLLQNVMTSKGETVFSNQIKMAPCQSQAMPDIIEGQSTSIGIYGNVNKLLFIFYFICL